MPKRTIQKITPPQAHSFDQQFWPIIVALTVLGGIAVGAILTLLRGPWMWGSLLILPIISALALYLLFRIDDSRLRRSLQLAIILSLAVHLLILIVTSATTIFNNPFEPPQKHVARRQERHILISDPRTQFVWQETNRRDTPEPDVQPEQTRPQHDTTTTARPQPVPVEQNRPQVQPQLTRRKTFAQTVPRMDKSLSQLRRQTRHQQIKSSQSDSQSASAENAPSVSFSEKTNDIQPTQSSAANEVQRQTATHSDSITSPQRPNQNTSEPKPNRTAKIPDSSLRRATPDRQTALSAPRPSTSSARQKNSVPDLPLAQSKTPDRPDATPTSKALTEPQPSQTASQITRRSTRTDTTRPSPTNARQSKSSPQAQALSAAQRRTSRNPAPTISSPSSPATEPRRSTTSATVAASPVPIERPSEKANSQSASRQLQSKTLSVSRSTAGVAGAGRSENLASATGGMTSPATQASATAVRRQSTSRPAETKLLSASQSSTRRRSQSAANTPTSAFQADTTASAKIAGSKTPTTESVEASAARVDSASAAARGEVSAEKGDTSVDLGPTKIVQDTTQARRQSGGGQPEISQLNPESTRRSRSTSDQQPTLLADTGIDTVAPRAPSSMAPDSLLEPNAESTNVTRSGGESPVSIDRDSAIDVGERSDQGSSDMVSELADSRRRAKRSETGGAEFEDDEDEEDNQTVGSQRTRVAHAPVTNKYPEIGSADADLGENITVADKRDDTPGESLATNLTRRSTSTLPGSGIGRSTTALLLQSALTLPVTDFGGPRRKESRSTNLGPADAMLDDSPTSTITDSGKRNTQAIPELSSPSTENEPVLVAVSDSESEHQIDSNSTAVRRSPASTAEQGAEMEIIAPEGPAGIGDLPEVALGVMKMPAARDSQQIQPQLNTRFRSSQFGGLPAINPDAVLAKEAFQKRMPAAVAGSSEPKTEAAIQLGLEFLARHQLPDGSWSLSSFDRDHPQHASQLHSDTAATGLALLAFQGAGYNHREFKYARTVNHALQWLMENQAEDGGLYVSADKRSDAACRFYSHGIAALALTEAYGMTQDVQIKPAAQKALDYITDTQDPRKGGWRYHAAPKLRSTDTSVTGWMMMALQSGRLAGLDVDEKVFRGIEQWLDLASAPDDVGRYRYNPYAVDTAGISRIQGRRASPSMTSVALLMRIYGGWKRDDNRLLDGATWMMNELMPSDESPQQRDTYYWYYATQVLKHIDGPLWERWDSKLRPLLIRSQIKTGDLAGSWHPYNPVPDRWGAFGGRLYVTTMNLLSLEVRHRMLPLYQKTNEE